MAAGLRVREEPKKAIPIHCQFIQTVRSRGYAPDEPGLLSGLWSLVSVVWCLCFVGICQLDRVSGLFYR